jgi:hypothetical protein
MSVTTTCSAGARYVSENTNDHIGTDAHKQIGGVTKALQKPAH